MNALEIDGELVTEVKADTCPKCGGEMGKVRWCSGIRFWREVGESGMNKPPAIPGCDSSKHDGDALHVTCECGFDRIRPCLDAKP